MSRCARGERSALAVRLGCSLTEGTSILRRGLAEQSPRSRHGSFRRRPPQRWSVRPASRPGNGSPRRAGGPAYRWTASSCTPRGGPLPGIEQLWKALAATACARRRPCTGDLRGATGTLCPRRAAPGPTGPVAFLPRPAAAGHRAAPGGAGGVFPGAPSAVRPRATGPTCPAHRLETNAPVSPVPRDCFPRPGGRWWESGRALRRRKAGSAPGWAGNRAWSGKRAATGARMGRASGRPPERSWHT